MVNTLTIDDHTVIPRQIERTGTGNDLTRAFHRAIHPVLVSVIIENFQHQFMCPGGECLFVAKQGRAVRYIRECDPL